MNDDKFFLRQDNNYRTLKAFQKAECIYDVTFYFAHQFLKSVDRTIDLCKAHLDSAIYREKIKERSDETIANIAITLIHQCDVLIRGLIEWKKRDFLENGGIKEEMYRARKEWQKRNGAYGKIDNGYYGRQYGRNGGNEPNGSNGRYGANGQSQPTVPTNSNQPTQPTTPK